MSIVTDPLRGHALLSTTGLGGVLAGALDMGLVEYCRADSSIGHSPRVSNVFQVCFSGSDVFKQEISSQRRRWR